MGNSKKPDELVKLFDLPAGHTATLSDSRERHGRGMEHQTYWFEERDAQQQMIARYRGWFTYCLKPPYRKQIGWERFSLSGDLLDREVRYSKRDDMQYLH